MNENIEALERIYKNIKSLNSSNQQIQQKYNGDEKYARIHKRILEQGTIDNNERKIFGALFGVKEDTDAQLLINNQLVENDGYFSRMVMPNVIGRFASEQKIKLDPLTSEYINQLVVTEYMKEFNNEARTW